VLEELRHGNYFRIASPDVEKPRNLTPVEKVANEKLDKLLQQKSMVREEFCWSYGCTNKAAVWVHEVSFDFKGEKAAPIHHRAVTTADYDGPVPGFCTFCLGTGPEKLAEAVYFARPEMVWGVRPNRWFVSFTDGLIVGGDCIQLNPKQESPKIVIEHHGHQSKVLGKS